MLFEARSEAADQQQGCGHSSLSCRLRGEAPDLLEVQQRRGAELFEVCLRPTHVGGLPSTMVLRLPDGVLDRDALTQERAPFFAPSECLALAALVVVGKHPQHSLLALALLTFPGLSQALLLQRARGTKVVGPSVK